MLQKGEFDDTDFELNSRSQPFHFEFEASQSQLLDADGFIKDSRSTKKVLIKFKLFFNVN